MNGNTKRVSGKFLLAASLITFGFFWCVMTASQAVTKPAVATTTAMRQMLGELRGHPTQHTPLPPQLNPPVSPFGNNSGVPDTFEMPALAPIANGPYVNFESPPVKPLALSSDGNTLFATNTPNGTLVVLQTSGGLSVVKEIPVGMDPVSVSVQPGTNNQIVWTANHVSDSVSVVNVVTGQVESVIDVGDEPVNILFNPSGSHAFVVIQGSRPWQTYELDSTNLDFGNLITVDTATRAVVSATFLDMHTPRAAVYDDAANRIIVAALHSGNNTTTVGLPVLVKHNEPPPAPEFQDPCDISCNCNCDSTPLLTILRDFSETSGIFAAAPELGPVYPDQHVDDNFPMEEPLVERIVPDMGRNSGWKSIVEKLTDDIGQPDPAMVAAMNAELNILNADEIIAEVVLDGLDTLDHDLVVLDASSPANPAGLPIIRFHGGVGATLAGMALNPANGKLLVSNMQPRNLVRLEPNLKGHFIDHEIRLVGGPFTLPIGGTTPFDLHAGIANFNDVSAPNLLAQRGSLANPRDIVIDVARQIAFVAALGSDRVGAINPNTGVVIGRVDVGREPRGLALDEPRGILYVLNRTDLSISTINVNVPSGMTVVNTLSLFNPEPSAVTNGRRFFYSTKFSNNFSSSCEMCHIDSDRDERAWDLGNPEGELDIVPPNAEIVGLTSHPLKGPMVTQSLRGLRGHEFFHWRGDREDIQAFNPAFEGLLGGSQLPQADIDAFAAFIDTIEYPPNPYYNRNNSFKDPVHALPGAVQFITSCNPCHNLHNDGALDLVTISIPSPIDGGFDGNGFFAQVTEVTQLRDIFSKFFTDKYGGVGTVHDGREVSEGNGHPLNTFLIDFFGFTPSQQQDMVAFVTAFPSNSMNVVGWQSHLNVVAQGDSFDAAGVVQADVEVMGAQFAKTHCDVIAKGFVAGTPIGFVLVNYVPPTNDPLPPVLTFEDSFGSTLTLTDLLASVAEGDSLTFMAVPPGSGRRMGIDQDLDCASDGYDLMPQQKNVSDGNYDGVVNVTDLLLMASCFGSSTTIACRPFDSDCNGIIDLADVVAFLLLYDVPSDCNGNGIQDAEEIIVGTATDANQDGIPDECPTITAIAVGSRYVQVDLGGDQPVAIQIQSADQSCTAMWVSPAGRIVDAPVYQLPVDWGTVYVADRELVPSRFYTLSVVSATFQRDALVQSWTWGDVNHMQGVNLDDMLCILKAFGGMFDAACTRQSADLTGTNYTPDGAFTLDDILSVLGAFSNLPYPDTNPCG